MAGLLDGLRLAGQRLRPELSDQQVMQRTPWRGELQQTSEVLPFGIYQQPDGSKRASWAWPGLMRGDDNALVSPAAAYGDDQAAADRNVGRVAIGNALGLTSARPFYSVPRNALGAAGSGTKPAGITAYHGSPHDFDRFDMSKIGTGEGAQAYGHGLYFAEREGVARSYRDALGGQRFKDGSAFDDANPAHQASAYISGTKSRDEALTAINDDIAMSRRQMDEKHAQILLRAKGMIQRGEPIPEMNQGRLYEVRINAEPEDFLDWDKPLSQQSEKVRKALPPAPEDVTGMQLINQLEQMVRASQPRTMADASFTAFNQDTSAAKLMITDKLREAGIPGIRYLDQGSRAKGEGSRNYVVFDDKLVDILRKYGLFGSLGAGAYAASGDGNTGLMP